MRSIKPGRGPSMLGAFMGIAVAIFGVLWTVMAFTMGAGPFALFGIVFIAMAVAIAVYHFKNATGKNRYSAYDITERGEEEDPLNARFGTRPPSGGNPTGDVVGEKRFCPYCGAKVERDHAFCSSCGRKLG